MQWSVSLVAYGASSYRLASFPPFLLDLMKDRFFCQLHFVFAYVKVLLGGSE